MDCLLDLRRFQAQKVDMLNLDNLRARIRGGGFKPFKVHLSHGRELSVTHPELIIVSRHVVVVATEEGVTYTVDLLYFVAISELDTGSPTSLSGQ